MFFDIGANIGRWSLSNLDQQTIKSSTADLTSSESMTDNEMTAAPDGQFQIFSGANKSPKIIAVEAALTIFHKLKMNTSEYSNIICLHR